MAEFVTKCPHCAQELEAETEWIGMEVECPVCHKAFTIRPAIQAKPIAIPVNIIPVSPAPAPAPAPAPVPAVEETKFIFICPECDTVAELPESIKGKEYECKFCCETSVATEATERKCPFCGEMIKMKANICRHCKSNVPPFTPSMQQQIPLTKSPSSQIQLTKSPVFQSIQPQPIQPQQYSNMNVNSNLQPLSNQLLTPAHVANKSWTGLMFCNLLLPGLGQVYLGQHKKGVICIAIGILGIVAACVLTIIPGIGALLGRIVFMLVLGVFSGESMATFAALCMGQSVDMNKWIPKAQQSNISNNLTPELKKKTKILIGVLIAAALLGFTGPGIIGTIFLICSSLA